MAVKQPRQAIVSIRLSEEEQERLRRIAEANGSTISDVVRGYVNQEMAGPLPRGESMPSAVHTRPGLNEGIFWVTGEGATAQGSTLTVRPLED